ncbi:alkaline phosphatase [Parapedobacter pyrenivorans]|uniref:Alkaline phosphatase n=1 Tax=Parapedobacter pyrenivorans TaxID=1305674 RepID=A0A917MEY1_9SPHI|nr:VTT domain-containing protein [Parapedobacter pyrenivorans]GGG94799.1 alkaline phosphatase [Parapedobacter pyrenivorans]
MQEFWDSFSQLLDAEALIRSGGFYLVIFIVFAETGLFFGFFLPGDYLLFLAGLFCASGMLSVDIFTLCMGLFVAGVLGNFTGYWFGWRTGPMLFKRKDTWLFKRRYVVMAEEFYHKYGGVALIIGRFMPIIRTFAPILAGIVQLDFRKFVLYNISGGAIWVLTLTLSGFFLGREFPQIVNYIEYIIVGFIAISFSPILIALIRRKLHLNKNEVEAKNKQP